MLKPLTTRRQIHIRVKRWLVLWKLLSRLISKKKRDKLLLEFFLKKHIATNSSNMKSILGTIIGINKFDNLKEVEKISWNIGYHSRHQTNYINNLRSNINWNHNQKAFTSEKIPGSNRPSKFIHEIFKHLTILMLVL